MTCTGGEFDVWLFPPSKQDRSSTSQLLRYVQGILNAGLKALFELSVRESWKSWRDPYLKTDLTSGKLQHALLKIFLRRFFSTAMVTKDAFFSLFALPEQSSSLLYGSSINSFATSLFVPVEYPLNTFSASVAGNVSFTFVRQTLVN